MGDEAVLEWELKYEELNLMFEEYKESSKEVRKSVYVLPNTVREHHL